MLLTIRLIHLNDSHSMLDRASRVKTVIEMARLVDPSSLFLFAGDALVGTPWYDLGGQGELDLQVMEALKPDAYVIGNHDLDGGVDHFRQVLGPKRIPLTVANWQIKGPLRYRVKPYRMRTVHGCRVAIIGLSIDPVEYGLPADAGISYQDPEKTLDELLPELKKRERPAAILVLSHLGQSYDERLAGFFPEVAAIIGGHSHSVITFPERFFHPNHSPSIVVQAGCCNEYVGLLDLDILGGKVANARGSLLRVSDDISPDTGIEAMLAPYQQAMAAYQVIIGKAGEAIPLWTREGYGSPLGDLVADWIRQAAILRLGLEVPIALLNQTGLRRSLPAGPITGRDVYEVYPFDNGLMVTTLTGVQVQAMLDHMASRGGDPLSGVTFTLVGNHATDVQVGGQPLQPDQPYRVASNSYLIQSGGSGYTVLTQGTDTRDCNLTIRTVIESAIAATAVIKRPKDVGQRIQRPAFDLDDEIRTRWGVGIAEAEPPFGRP